MYSYLDIKRLRYFKAIADHKSLSAASRALHIAQPALSHHVARLEAHIGARLLDRHHNGVTLTDVGRVLLRHAANILAQVELAETELSGYSKVRSSKVNIRLAIISSLAADLTPILIEALSRDLPEVTLRITESSTQESRDMLERGEADLSIYLNPHGQTEDKPIARERLFLVSAANKELVADPVSFATVIQTPLIMPAKGNPLRLILERAAANAGLALNITLEVDGTESRRNAVQANLGSTIFAGHSVYGKARNVGIIARPIISPTLYRPIFFGARNGFEPELFTRIRRVLARLFQNFGGVEVAVLRSNAQQS